MTAQPIEICHAAGAANCNPTTVNSNSEILIDLHDLELMLSMLRVAIEATGTPDIDGTITYYGVQLTPNDPPAFTVYGQIHSAVPDWQATKKILGTAAALTRMLSPAARTALNAPAIVRFPQNPSTTNVKNWLENKVLNNANIVNWIKNLTEEQLDQVAASLTGSHAEDDKKIIDNLKKLVRMLTRAREATGNPTVPETITNYGCQLSGSPEPCAETDTNTGAWDIYYEIHNADPSRQFTIKAKLSVIQLVRDLPEEIQQRLGFNPDNPQAWLDGWCARSQDNSLKIVELEALVDELIVEHCGQPAEPPPPVCPGDPSCPPEPGVLPPPLLNPLAYDGAGELNWLDNLAYKYHLLPHAQLGIGGQYQSLAGDEIGQPDSSVSLGGSAGLDWSAAVGEGYTLSLGADGGYHYQGVFGAEGEPGFGTGFLSGSVAGLSTNYIPNFQLGIRGVFTDNDRSELSPWTSPTGNAFSLNALISQPVWRFGSGVLSVDVPGGLDLGWYEPFGPGSGPLPDESPNFMRGTIGGGLRLNLDVPISLFAGYRHIWEMPSRYFMDQAYGFQTYEGNGAYLGLGAQAGIWSGNFMFNYDVMTNWNDQWKASYFNQFDLGNFAPGFGVSAGQGNFYDIQSTDVNGEVGVYDIQIDPLSTNYFETTLDVVANGGYSWLDNGSEGYVVGGGLRINFGPVSDPTGVEELSPAGAMMVTDAQLTDDYLTAETDEVGSTYTDPRVIQMLGVAPAAITAQMVEDYAEMFKSGKLNSIYQLTAGSFGDDGDCSVAVEDEDNAIAFGDVAPVPANLEPQQYVMIGAARYTVANTQSDAENPVQASILGTLLAQAALHVARMLVDNDFYFIGEDDNRIPQDLY